MRRLLTLAFLLVALFLAVKLLGAAGFFAFAAACALLSLARSTPEDRQLVVEDMRLVINRRFATAIFIFLILILLFFSSFSNVLEWLSVPQIGTIEKISSVPPLDFGEVIYPYLPLDSAEDLKYQVIYTNQSDRSLSNIVVTTVISPKPSGLVGLLLGANMSITRTLTLEVIPARSRGILYIAVDSPPLKGDTWLRSLSFLLDTVWLRLLWSAILAVLSAVIVVLAFLLAVGYFGSRAMYGEYEQYRGHELEAIYSAISIVLGMSKGVWLVREGKAEVLHPPAGGLARFGGPGVLIVQEGHAVILERGGQLSRVVGRGVAWLQPLERVSMVVPLQTRGEHVIVKQVATKDRILIDEFEFWAFHKVDQGPEEMRIQSGQFVYNEDILLKKIWVMSGDDWSGGVKALSETAARDVVGRYDLEQIVAIADQFRVDFKEALKQQINRVAKDFMGVDVVAVDIGRIKVPEDAEHRLLAKWLADWEVRIATSEREAMIRKGEAEAVILKIKEVAWAQAQKLVIEEITKGFQIAGFQDMGVSGRDQICYLIALRALETLEKMAGDPATKILLPGDVSMQLQEIRRAIGGPMSPGLLVSTG